MNKTNKEKVTKLIEKFRDDFGYYEPEEDFKRGLYWIEFFLDRIYAEGFEVCQKSNAVDGRKNEER